MTQEVLFDTRPETRPLRKVVDRQFVTETKSRLLLECGHSLENVHYSQAEGKRKRCTKCSAYGDDADGLKYAIPEGL